MILEIFYIVLSLAIVLIFFRKLLKINVNPKIEKVVKYLTIIHVFALIIFFVLFRQGIYLRGFKSLTFFLISTLFIVIGYYLYSSIKGILRYVFLVVLLLSIILTTLIVSLSLYDYSKSNFFENSNYRVEKFKSVFGPYRAPVLFEKNGLFEKERKLYFQNEPHKPFKKEVDSVKIIKVNNNYQVIFYLKNNKIYRAQTKNL